MGPLFSGGVVPLLVPVRGPYGEVGAFRVGEYQRADGGNGLHHPCFRQAHARLFSGMEQAEHGFLFLMVRLAGVSAGRAHSRSGGYAPQHAQFSWAAPAKASTSRSRQGTDQKGAVGVILASHSAPTVWLRGC